MRGAAGAGAAGRGRVPAVVGVEPGFRHRTRRGLVRRRERGSTQARVVCATAVWVCGSWCGALRTTVGTSRHGVPWRDGLRVVARPHDGPLSPAGGAAQPAGYARVRRGAGCARRRPGTAPPAQRQGEDDREEDQRDGLDRVNATTWSSTGSRSRGAGSRAQRDAECGVRRRRSATARSTSVRPAGRARHRVPSGRSLVARAPRAHVGSSPAVGTCCGGAARRSRRTRQRWLAPATRPHRALEATSLFHVEIDLGSRTHADEDTTDEGDITSRPGHTRLTAADADAPGSRRPAMVRPRSPTSRRRSVARVAPHQLPGVGSPSPALLARRRRALRLPVLDLAFERSGSCSVPFNALVAGAARA